ncbi:MAG: carboxypeptidase-like regulatory domain-containing protein [Pyrinomonadaceae bacterium]
MKSRWTLLALLLVISSATFAQTILAGAGAGSKVKLPPPGTITVNVTADGGPLTGAVVLLMSDAGGAPTLVADRETDKAGQVTFPAKPGQPYHVTVGLPGYDVQPHVYDLKYKGGAAQLSFVATKGD